MIEEMILIWRTNQSAGIDCIGKEIIPEFDELNPDIIRRAVFGTERETLTSEKQAVMRPPTLCAGCPHRGFFQVLKSKKNVMITGDIGCYTLGSAPPLSAMDTCFCMGGSISAGHGAATAFRMTGRDTKVVTVLGDSTFFHSGIQPMDSYNKGNCVTVILDNPYGNDRHQDNREPARPMGELASGADIPLLAKPSASRKTIFL